MNGIKREYVIRADEYDINNLKPDCIRIIDHDEEYDPSMCMCQISFLDDKPPMTYDDLKQRYDELMNAEPMRLLRLKRNTLLEQSDYKFKPDYKHKSNTHKRIWEEYREHLRQLPAIAKPELTSEGDLSYNFRPAPLDEYIMIDPMDDLYNESPSEKIVIENLKLKDDLKKLKQQVKQIMNQIGIMGYVPSSDEEI